MSEELYGASAEDLLSRWDAGQIVHTIEMGGMGPGYEQCIQIMAFEMIRYMVAHPVDWQRVSEEHDDASVSRSDRYWTKYADAMDDDIFAEGSVCKELGVSGAQHGAAVSLAAQFVRNGPVKVMTDDRVKDRHIMASKTFPTAA